MFFLKELSQIESNMTAEYLATQIPGHPSAEQCLDGECLICSVRDCPHKEPLHYDHEGCPACDAPHETIEGFEDAEHLDGDTAKEA